MKTIANSKTKEELKPIAVKQDPDLESANKVRESLSSMVPEAQMVDFCRDLVMAALLRKNFPGVVEHCTSGLALEPDDRSFLLRRAQAQYMLGKKDLSIADLHRMILLTDDRLEREKLQRLCIEIEK